MSALAPLMPCEIPPGIAVIARFDEGRCAAGRIICHRGMRLIPAGSGYLLSTDDADAVHFAIYRDDAVSVEREPYLHSDAAYIPLDFTQLRTTSIAGYGRMLVEKTIRHLGLDTRVANDGVCTLFRIVHDVAELRSVFAQIMAHAGVPRDELQALSGAAARLAVPA